MDWCAEKAGAVQKPFGRVSGDFVQARETAFPRACSVNLLEL